MLRAFLEAVHEGKDVPVAAEAGRYAVELCWAALQSAREGRPVGLPITPDAYPSYTPA